MKQKRDRTLKVRGCADGRRQRKNLEEDENALSLTVTLEGFFATLMIDADERRDIATFDVTRAFLKPALSRKDDKCL